MTILQDLYHGNIKLGLQAPPNSTEYKNARSDFRQHYHVLSEKLNDIDPSLVSELELMLEKQSFVSFYEEENLFNAAFVLGCRLMLEVMEHDWT